MIIISLPTMTMELFFFQHTPHLDFITSSLLIGFAELIHKGGIQTQARTMGGIPRTPNSWSLTFPLLLSGV